jgi:predicted DNA-binding transcriptional regulator YafY
MAKKSPADIAARRRAVINLLSSEVGKAVEELMDELPGHMGRRTVHEDLAFLRANFPTQLERLRANGQHGTSRVAYRWTGAIPHLLDQPIGWLAEDELMALIAARGLLHHNDRSLAGGAQGGDGLGAAAHRLIARTALDAPAQTIGRHLIAVSRFGAAPVVDDHVATCLLAAASLQAISFTYTNLDGATKHRVAAPQRLVLIRGEWYCVAWQDCLRQFKLARMADVQISAAMPAGMPSHIDSSEVNALLDGSFFATGSLDRSRRRRVVLAVAPGAWPFVQGRTWGTHQRLDEAPADLPAGWRRLTFTTTGLDECRHWVLSMSGGVHAEEPAELVTWLREVADRISAAHQGQP